MGKRRAHRRRTKGTKSNTNPEPPSSQNGEDRDLPEEPLLKVLTTLPVKTLCRFRCVSNRWNSLISDPLFVRLYLSQAHNPSSSSSSSSSCSSSLAMPWTLLYRNNDRFSKKSSIPDILKFERIYSDHSYNKERATFSVLDFPPSVQEKHQAFPNKYRILASSDGLLLCCVNYPTIYYVCNPVTRQWVALPYHTQFFGSVSEGLVTQVEGGVVTSYKVVRLCCDAGYTDYDGFRGIEIFNSEDGEWRTSKVKFPYIDSFLSPTSFNGILHYIISNGIVAYDPYKDIDQCRLIVNPFDWGYWPPSYPSRGYNHDNGVLCGVCQGHLQYIVQDSDSFKLWVLEDYNNGKWHLEHSIDYLSDDYYPLAFHPFDSAIVYLFRKTKIFSYDMLSKRLVTLLDVGFDDDLSVSMVLPFVLPLWPTPVPKP